MTTPLQCVMAQSMHAMLVRGLGGPEVLELTELPDPELAPGHVRIDVQASGVNFGDLLICQGRYQIRPELPFSPGNEVAGVVRDVASDVHGMQAGDRVLALLGHGGYASVVVAPSQDVFTLPGDLPFEIAAGFGVAYQTAYLALCDRARLQVGEVLLVHGAAGGVGLAAVQLGRALGAQVIAIASGEDKLSLCRQEGAAHAFDVDSDWPARVLEISEGRGADVIYDSIGGDVSERSLKCIAFDGRLLVIGFASGTIPEVKLNRVMLKNIGILGLHIHAYREKAPARVRQAMSTLFELARTGRITPRVDRVLPLAQAAEALRLLQARKTTGKLLLRP